MRWTLGIGMVCVCATAACAGPVDWVNWTSYTLGTPSGASAQGTLASGGISVTFSGHLYDVWLSPAQSGNVDPWPGPPFYTAYDTPLVTNRPPNHQILWQARYVTTNTVTFSQPVTDLFMTVSSLGGGVGSLYAVEWDFNVPFDIVSQGSGRYGTGVFEERPGDVLHGEEGHGIIRFAGPVTSITWASSYVAYEGTNGFQFGIAVPSPGCGAMVAAGLGALSGRRRRG